MSGKISEAELSAAVMKEASKKISDAIDAVLDILHKKVIVQMQEVINTNMLEYYYNGYKPIRYKRTENLKNTLAKPFIDSFDNGNERGFVVGVEYFYENMKHFKIVKKKKVRLSKANELKIAQNFSLGIHPNGKPSAGTPDQGPIWTMTGGDEPTGSAVQVMEAWLQDNIQELYNQAVAEVKRKL